MSSQITSMSVAVLLGLAMLMPPAMASEAIPVEQVQFARGSSSAKLKGQIVGNKVQDYKLRAKAGQTLSVALNARSTSVNFNILPPGSNDVAIFSSASTGETSRKVVLEQDGEYTIRVYQMGNRKSSGTRTPYEISVAIEALEASAVTLPAHYDASGSVACGTRDAALDQRCTFRVVRALQSADVWVQQPGSNHYRALRYTQEQFSSTDGASISARRISDNWKVGVGKREVYMIPDALLFGG
ncbi:PPC domain-containing protein [Chitinibacteraceae bacterium HSL-7]